MLISDKVLDPSVKKLVTAWLLLGVGSLIAAGIFSVLLVLSRTPAIQEMIPLIDFFHVALVVHVDLSVLIWFLSFAGALWSYFLIHSVTLWDKAALFFAITGTFIITVVPFFGIGNPIMNNYIPVLDHPVFLNGLNIFGIGICLFVIRILFSFPQLKKSEYPVLPYAAYLAAITTLFSIGALITSYLAIPADWNGEIYYETLFWGGGHVLQFTHSILMLVAWAWLAHTSGASIKLSNKLSMLLFTLTALPVISTPLIYIYHEVTSAEHMIFFTELMRYGGLATVPLGGIIVWHIITSGKTQRQHRPIKAALLCSIALFAVGGVIGFLIEGVNVVIPAHYHGSIVGVTLSFMGLTYYLLPQLGFAQPTPRLAHMQPYIYAGGQLMHIIGLAWSGGYGIQRKTAGTAQGLDNLPEIAGMALMGMGGLISIIGGFLFIIVAIKSVRNRHSVT